MTEALSPNTQAILLLTAPLVVGRGADAERPLSASDYSRLAILLRDAGRQPSDLLSHPAPVLAECARVLDPKRLERLLARGFLLSQAVERWQSRSIWVISRADASYPRRLKALLGQAAPPILYGVGDVAALDRGGLAVVGSREADEDGLSYARAVGEMCARSGRAVVSGGARGIDQAAMQGTLAAGGCALGVLADSLERAALARTNRDALMARKLTLTSAYDPSAGFNAGHAMQRNKLIYALADAGLVVASDRDKGGTWAGAIEQLETLRHVRVYVRATSSPGLDALAARGAERWPEPAEAELEWLLRPLAASSPQATLKLDGRKERGAA